jgi:hypothetical protein
VFVACIRRQGRSPRDTVTVEEMALGARLELAT